jgi:signal transduction histidine kinase
MRKSVFLRRIVLLLLAAVLLSGVITATIYMLVTQRTYVQTKAEELVPIARTIAEMFAKREVPNVSEPVFNRGNKNFLGAELFIFGADGNPIMGEPPGITPFNDIRSNTQRLFDIVPSELANLLASNVSLVLSGADISEIRKSTKGNSFLIVGVPISDGVTISGAVIFTKPLSELTESASGLYWTLVISTLISFIIMLFPGFLAARQLVVPLKQMQSVARAMAKGEFSERADETQAGEIGELGRSINHFALESERLEKTRRDFVANVSHELRTPIASIRAMGETLRDGMAKTEDKKSLFYNNIVRESLRLSRLVDDLLELSRLQSGSEAIKKVYFDLYEIFNNIKDTFGESAVEAGITLNIELSNKSQRVFSNPDRVEQLLIIIMDNALKYTYENGIVTLTGRIDGNKTIVSVSNTGTTISKDDLTNIFERFYKADKSHSGEGYGLGLSIANEIVNGLGESIRAESFEGLTTFAFTISLDD